MSAPTSDPFPPSTVPDTPPDAPPKPHDRTAISPDARTVWRAARGPLLLAVLIVFVVSVLVLLTGGRERGALDPRAVDPSGSRALAELLRRQGVDVVPVGDLDTLRDRFDRAPDQTTILVPFPEALTAEQRAAVAALSPARTVLIGPGPFTLDAYDLDVGYTGETPQTDADPNCDLPAAARAGDADIGGRGYATNNPDAARCYPVDGEPGLVVVPHTRGDVVVLGSGDALRNDRLDERGNASLTMQLLGGYETLLWYLPDGSDAGDEGLLDLLPAGWRFGTLQLGIAVVLFALYRARRLGPVVTEPLPVVVRATETAEGRARLYHRGHTVDRAAAELRAAARTRLAARLGLGGSTEPSPDALADAVATRTGRAPAEVRHLLYGAVPEDESGLVTLADHLDRLEELVRTGVREP